MPSVWPSLIPYACPRPSATARPATHGDEREQIVFAARGAGHALEELPAIEDADAVQEHDQAGEADRPDDLRLGAKAPMARPTNRTAPTPSENPPRLICPTR